MNELIITSGSEVTLTRDAEQMYVELEREIAAYKALQDDLKANIKAAMEKHGIKAFKGELVDFTYIDETERETFDSKKFRADNPDLYDEYVSMTPVKSSLRVKVHAD